MSYPNEPPDPTDSKKGGVSPSVSPAAPAWIPDPDADPTERFTREEERISIRVGGSVLHVQHPRNTDIDDLALTQPLPKLDSDDFDEDLIRTRELPAPDDSWLQEWLARDGEGRERMPSRPGSEASGVFPHPATAAAAMGGTVRRRSAADLPVASQSHETDDDAAIEARFSRAYHDYLQLCRAHRQTVVDEEEFVEVLRGRLERLKKQYPPEAIEFRAVFDDGQVRVRVMLRKRPQG